MPTALAMKKAAAGHRPRPEAAGGFLSEIWWVAWRSLTKLTRSPMLLFFSLFMPLIWLALFSQTFGTVFARGAGPPGAPVPDYDYVAVLLPAIAVMTAIQSASQSGFSMVADIETGFMDKFFVAPIRRGSVLIGKMLADGIRMACQAAIVLAIAALMTVVAGWRIPFATGVPGAALVVLLATGFGLAFSGLSNTVALRTRNTEATMMVSFTLTFPLLFMSTAMLPKGLLPQWVQDFSAVNPVSYLADASRALIIEGYD
ncbi:MAG: ABC transporter permease, partial [Candidatus Rokuibacteriota bacterium]